MRIKSVRTALLLGVNLIVIAVLALTAWASYRNTLHEINELFDAELAQTARLIKSLTHDQGFIVDSEQTIVIELPTFRVAEPDDRLNDGHKYETKLGFQVWRDEQLILASENALGEALALFQTGYQEHYREHHNWVSFSHYDNSTGLWIFTAQREDIRAELSSYLARDQLLALLLTWVPISLAMLWLINWVLRPVQRYASILDSRQIDQLARIDAVLPSEIEPIRNAVNSLLVRLAEQIERERRFIQDAAHELRTPLAALSLHAEQLPEPQHVSSQAVRSISQRMNHLIEQLLILAKADNPNTTLGEPEQIKLRELIERIIGELPLGKIEHTEWHVDCPSEIQVSGYPLLLHAALRNLIDNALQYSAQEPHISITVQQLTTHTHITVADHGPGLSAEQIQQLGQRFYRADQHRQRLRGSGLGLSIVARVAALHGGSLQFSQGEPHGLAATISLTR